MAMSTSLWWFEEIKKDCNISFVLKAEQITVINLLLDNNKVFAVLPTGYGKSLIYILLPLALDKIKSKKTTYHVSLVVSPLRSLMFNQVELLKQMGVSAAVILPLNEINQDTKRGILAGNFSVIFCSPEALTLDLWKQMVIGLGERLCLFACDEAHCISEWGLDFRPEYKKVGKIYSMLPKSTRWLFLTATCTDAVHASVLGIFNILQDQVTTIAAVRIPDRKNIYLKWKSGVKDYLQEVQWLVDDLRSKGLKAEKTIIYCRSINQVGIVYEDLLYRLGEAAWQHKSHSSENCIISLYHGTISPLHEQYVLQNFTNKDSTIRLIICTIAFGMGIQVADIRHIIHFGPSKTPLHYWQEVGRAGRDGLPSSATLLIGPRARDKRIVSSEMLQVCGQIENDNRCVRATCLDAIRMQQMPQLSMQRIVCPKHCSDCQCEACCCCSKCRSSCPCRQ